tara:strand:- start:12911 stop:13537 length:627 start_codon:yes stop_codon:yes gene_type:complete
MSLPTLKQFIKETLNKTYGSLLEEDFQDLGLFVTVPENIVRKIERSFPDFASDENEDTSPKHITLLIINKDFANLEKIQNIIKNVLENIKPFAINLCGTDKFEPHKDKDEYVFYAKAASNMLLELHYKIRDALENAGIEINHYYGDDPEEKRIYKPHMTLAYYDDEEEFRRNEETQIYASWYIDRVELWGYGSPIVLKLSNNQAQQNT